MRNFIIWMAVLLGVFCVPLFQLSRFAAASGLFSYILLVPFISGYLIWLNRKALASGPNPLLPSPSAPLRRDRSPSAPIQQEQMNTLSPSRGSEAGLMEGERDGVRGNSSSEKSILGMIFLAAGVLAFAFYAAVEWTDAAWPRADTLALAVTSFLCLAIGGGLLCFGQAVLARIAFPIGFLFFMLPLPVAIESGVDTFFQHTSAAATSVLLELSGTPYYREELKFKLPGITILVAPECSGIRSTLVLFMTSLLGGYLFLRAPWRRSAFALSVIPLAILRNGLRIFTIALLCVHIGPEMIHSAIHRRGGPVFFALSLAPLFLFLLVLRKTEGRDQKSAVSGQRSGLPPDC